MPKGTIYIMTTAVPGLIKIGKTQTSRYEDRMYGLEHNGYRNVTALKRIFAIEVEDYDEKELLLHTIFAKSRVDNTELFALDVNIAIQLLSSFEGTIIYPKTETKDTIFEEATDTAAGQLIPNGTYIYKRTKVSENNRKLLAEVQVLNGEWTLKKGSVISSNPIDDIPQKVKVIRASLRVDADGKLLEDVCLGTVSPSCAATVVYGQSSNGWSNWKDKNGIPISVHRKNSKCEEEV